MAKPLLSVIVPCYNAERFLPNCFKCFDLQNYKNLQVIFVDGGSTDGTYKLLENYCALHPDYTVIRTENEGVASARNKGLDAVKGEFCAFADADDVFYYNHFELLVKSVTENKVDMAVCGIKRVSEKKAEKIDLRPSPRSAKLKFYDKIQGLEQFFSQEKFDFLLMNKIFSTEIIKKSGARFLDGCRYGEESFFFFKYLSYCDKTVYYGAKTYVYVQRKGSLMHSGFNENRLDVYKNIQAVINEMESGENFKSVLPYVKVMRAGYSVGILHYILRGKYKNSRVIAESVQTLSKDVKSLKKCPKVAFYKKALLPPCAVVAKIVLKKHLKKEKTN
ncbi:MAG: glycosyltransferase [Clostridia bacterium]|nr:glycosyltransferase [Clostridia bacterium]